MNSTAELLERLRSLDIRLTLDGDRLGVNAPKGALTPELREELGRRKDEVKAFLAARPRCDTAIPLNAVPRSARMPVSHTQQRLWFIKRMDPNGHVYNIAAALRMTGSLNHNSLERTLADLVARHERLRTRFYAIDGTPYCTIDAQARVTLDPNGFVVLNLLELPVGSLALGPERPGALVATAGKEFLARD